MIRVHGQTGRLVATLGVALLAAVAGCDRFGMGGGEQNASGGDIDDSFEPHRVESVKGVATAEIQAVLQKRIEGKAPAPVTAEQWAHARKLYEAYGGLPLWLDGDGLRERRSKTLMTALLNAEADALSLDDYPLERLRRALATLREVSRPNAEQLADADLMLTVTYVALGEDLLTGQVNPETISQDWHIDVIDAQIDSALARSLRDRAFDQTVTSMRPQDEGYKELRQQLIRYRQLVEQGGWEPVPEGKAVKPRDSAPSARLAALRARLRVEGFLDDTSAANGSPNDSAAARDGGAVYDTELAGAVARFQREHSIVVDSVLGAETVKAMNVSAEYRLGQIAANLERYRWMPRSLGSKYVLVNVPAFELEAYEEGKKALEMKVIVGAEYENRATPTFSDSMQYVVFRPYWNAPDSIAIKEIWPKVEADPTYLERNNYEIVNEGGKQRIRQTPGETNALGLVKFMFPNDFAIYLHDTPEAALFDRDVRAFSHGCIRLEKPEEMAQWVLGWSADSVKRAMEEGKDNRHVNLKEKVPVFIVYFTTFMRDGRLHFGNDLYGRDQELVQAVSRGAMPSVDVVREVKALRELAED